MRGAVTAGALAIAASVAHAQPCDGGQTLRGDVDMRNVTLLDAAATLDHLKRRFELVLGRCITPRLAIDIAEELKGLYAAAGYGAIRVDLPSLSEADGRLGIRVVEGRLSAEPEVRLSAEPGVDSAKRRADVLASLPALAPGRPLRIHELDAQLRLANENPSKEVQVLLTPSERVEGEIHAELRVREAPLRELRLTVDNTGTASTGRHRIAVGWRHADATGNDDVASVQYQTSPEKPGSVRVFSAGYKKPFYAHALALELYATASSVEGRHATAAGDLALNGEGRLAGAKLSRLLRRWGEFDQRVGVGIDYRHYRNQCEILGLPEGACGAAGESVTLVPLTLEYTAQRSGELPAAVALRVQRNLGFGSSTEDLARSRSGASRDAWPIRYAATMLVPVADDWQLALKGIGQWSSQPLVPGEMFGAGGPTTVRGYQEREIAGDIGLGGTLEFGRLGLLTPETGGDAAAHVYGFVDGAVVRNRGGLECEAGSTRCDIASVGVGVRASWRRWSLQLDVGYAQRETAQTRRGTHRGHFVLGTRFGY